MGINNIALMCRNSNDNNYKKEDTASALFSREICGDHKTLHNATSSARLASKISSHRDRQRIEQFFVRHLISPRSGTVIVQKSRKHDLSVYLRRRFSGSDRVLGLLCSREFPNKFMTHYNSLHAMLSRLVSVG